jgi:N6-L-threonylcarbamoyladenine synthase
MLVLGIETTCDETAAAVVERHDDGRGAILSNVVLSQIAEHAAFGGVVPEIAARAHVEALDLIIATAMADAGRDFSALDGIAAAAGPGLIGGVIVGLTTGKAIALVHEKPLIAVNHLEAHALTARLTDGVAFPYCLFLASGGHTQIVAVRGVGDYVRLGTTRDDAIGEAFDKTAKLLGLGYPGGPRVEQEAARGDAARFTLPRPMIGRRDADFSLSGLKTALRLEAEKIAPLSDQDVADLCAAFQRAVTDTVTDRLRHGLRMFRERFGVPAALVASGGVAANGAIRAALLSLAAEDGVALVVPPPGLCTDNGAMIAWAGAERLAHGMCDMLDTAPRARWPLAQVTRPAGSEEPGEPGTAGVPPALPAVAAGAEESAGEAPAVPAAAPPVQQTQQTPEAEKAETTATADAANLADAAPPSSPPQAEEGQEGGTAAGTESASTEQVASPPPQSSATSGRASGKEPAPTEGATTAAPAQASATSDIASAEPAVSEPAAGPDQPSERDIAPPVTATEPAQPDAPDTASAETPAAPTTASSDTPAAPETESAEPAAGPAEPSKPTESAAPGDTTPSAAA